MTSWSARAKASRAVFQKFSRLELPLIQSTPLQPNLVLRERWLSAGWTWPGHSGFLDTLPSSPMGSEGRAPSDSRSTNERTRVVVFMDRTAALCSALHHAHSNEFAHGKKCPRRPCGRRRRRNFRIWIALITVADEVWLRDWDLEAVIYRIGRRKIICWLHT